MSLFQNFPVTSASTMHSAQGCRPLNIGVLSQLPHRCSCVEAQVWSACSRVGLVLPALNVVAGHPIFRTLQTSCVIHASIKSELDSYLQALIRKSAPLQQTKDTPNI
jgi:hypothetical protein